MQLGTLTLKVFANPATNAVRGTDSNKVYEKRS